MSHKIGQLSKVNTRVPLSRQRRSAFNWFGLVPDEVARAQVTWERLATVTAAQKAGLTLAQAGKVVGVSREAARCMVEKYKRICRHPVRRGRSPVEVYQSQAGTDFRSLGIALAKSAAAVTPPWVNVGQHIVAEAMLYPGAA